MATRCKWWMVLVSCVGLAAVLAWMGLGTGGAAARPGPLATAPATGHVDLLIFAPHPDDETLGCTGIILQALAEGKRIRVVDFTNGDGFPAAASALTGKPLDQLTPADFRELARRRELEVAHALAILGLAPGDLTLLGYPDSGLDAVYQRSQGEPYRQKFTEATTTYAMSQRDYHSAAHGSPAPYTRAAALGDTAELIAQLCPSQVYVTSPHDGHADHRAAYGFVHDAMATARFHGEFYTYLIHASGPPSEWPWPHAVTPLQPFALHRYEDQAVPAGLPWPPPRHVALTPAQAARKLEAIHAHLSRENAASRRLMPGEREFLEAFVKSEEIFWPGGE